MKKLEILLKRIILYLFLKYHREKNSVNSIEDFTNKKVLFIRLNRIGDALVTTPYSFYKV
jgi:hypothetical protein